MEVISQDTHPASIFLIFALIVIPLSVLLFYVAFKLILQNSPSEFTLIGNDLVNNSDLPHAYLNDEESLMQLADEYDFTNLSPEEQSAYLKGQEFAIDNPPNFHNSRGKTLTREDELLIRDRGINAFEFEQEKDILQARYIVGDRTEIYFNENNNPYSTATSVLNYPLPIKNKFHSDTVYFEVKIFEYSNKLPNSHFSIGLVTKPYPSSFRLPGYNNFSIGYESTGNLKINKPFPTPLQQHMGEQSQFNALVLPPLQQSDVVGFGYFIPTGTIFITRNGKKVMDVMKGCHVDLFPAVGCFSCNAKFQVNLGQLGYVWIEANVKKYGFVSTNEFRKLDGDRGMATLPEYGNIKHGDNDKLLDKGDELPPGYPEHELDFFGRSIRADSSKSQNKQNNEKPEEGEVEETKIHRSSSRVTREPEEVMDLRERIYEQNIANDLSESSPLIDMDSEYVSQYTEEPSSTSKEETPLSDSAEDVTSPLNKNLFSDQPESFSVAQASSKPKSASKKKKSNKKKKKNKRK